MKSGARLLLFLALVLVIWVIVKGWERGPRGAAEDTAALRGEALARELGCFGCHGPAGRGGVEDPLLPEAGVPGWSGGVLQSYARSEAEIREWILDGVSERLKDRPPEARPGGLLPMPAYRDLLSEGQVDDLMAYVLAVAAWDEGMPGAAYEGKELARRLGCFGCHGPSGIGGLPNPGSFKGVIPSWEGEWYAELVRDDDELRAWILDGAPPRLTESALARRYLEGQRIQMPAYREHVSDAELEAMVAYLAWLRRERE
ncbi:MAG: c-type cytochrome [Deltaproteobacteria bacterium]|nr:c-type cytochrome [Deltaproteobacteria bacterium]